MNSSPAPTSPIDWHSLDQWFKLWYAPLVETLDHSLNLFQSTPDANHDDQQTRHLAMRHKTQAVLNGLQAWQALASLKSGTASLQPQVVRQSALPSWWQDFDAHTQLRIDFQPAINVHLALFIESILLLHQVARHLSEAVIVQVINTANADGVFVRVIFTHQEDKTSFSSLSQLQSQLRQQAELHQQTPHAQHLGLRLGAAQAMIDLNNSRLKLQENRITGQQAFSMYFKAYQPKLTQPSVQAADGMAKSTDTLRMEPISSSQTQREPTPSQTAQPKPSSDPATQQ